MGHHSTRAEGYEDWLKVDRASRTSATQTAAKKVVSRRVNKKLSKLSFKDKGIRVGFGSIKHWLRRDNLALHHHLFTFRRYWRRPYQVVASILILQRVLALCFLDSLYG